MDPAIEAYKIYAESDKTTQACFVNLYESLRLLPRTERNDSILKKLAEFGINEKRTAGHRLLPTSQRQINIINRLTGLRRESLPPLPSGLPPLLRPLHQIPYYSAPLIVPGIPRTHFSTVEETAQGMITTMVNRLQAEEDVNPPVIEFMQLLSCIEEDALHRKLAPVVQMIKSYTWSSTGFLIPPKKQHLIQSIWESQKSNFSLTISEKRRLKTTDVVMEMIRSLISDLCDPQKQPDEVIREFQEVIQAICEQEPIVKHEIDVILALLSRAHLTDRVSLAHDLKNLID